MGRQNGGKDARKDTKCIQKPKVIILLLPEAQLKNFVN